MTTWKLIIFYVKLHMSMEMTWLDSASLITLSVFMSDRKRGYGGHFFSNCNKLFVFPGKCLETWQMKTSIGIVRFYVPFKLMP